MTVLAMLAIIAPVVFLLIWFWVGVRLVIVPKIRQAVEDRRHYLAVSAKYDGGITRAALERDYAESRATNDRIILASNDPSLMDNDQFIRWFDRQFNRPPNMFEEYGVD